MSESTPNALAIALATTIPRLRAAMTEVTIKSILGLLERLPLLIADPQ
jgi:hypothetical protein